MGFGDPRLRLTINLIGAEALTPQQFARRDARTSLGASVVVVAPLGEYDATKLINLGANRWALKAELGWSQPIGRWDVEAYAGAWFFGDNARFLTDARREQEPIITLQGHVSYTFRPQLWLAADATYYQGGQTTIDGRSGADRQSNSRLGLTLSLPITRQHSMKVTFSDGFTTRIGGDFTSVGIAWQYFWLD